jgi:hypothetical protein
MIHQPGSAILQALRTVEAERAERDADPTLGDQVRSLKQYQQRRFALTYADLLADARYGGAARFFLEELYGPRDYRERDAQFARVVPALVRLFPDEVVSTVATLSALHALSESLDTAMAHALQTTPIDAAAYVLAWRQTGCTADREQQIALTLDVGRALDVYTRSPWLRNSLRMMRGPARVAGLSELQRFLESGFDTFRAMRGAEYFLEQIDSREHAFKQCLFESAAQAALGQLP